MLFVAISILPLLIMAVYRYPLVLLSLFPIVSSLDALFVFNLTQMGDFYVVPMDLVYFFTIAYLGIYVLRNPRTVLAALRENIFLTAFLVLTVFYVVIYTPAYGQSAIGEARKLYGFFVIPLLALIVIKTSQDLRRFIQVIIVSAVFVAVGAVERGAAQGSLIRSVYSDASLIIAFATFGMLLHYFHRVVIFHPTVDRVLLLVFGALALISGQRSVWIATAFGAIFVLWLYLRRPGWLVKYGVVAVALLMVAASALVYFPTVGKNLGEKLAGILDPYSDDTASWRMEGWQYQLGELQESGDLLFGEGVGGYYSWRFSGGGEVTASPHNAYVQMTLKLGLFGLLVYSLLVFEFFRRTSAHRKNLPPGPLRACLEMGMVNFGAAHGYMVGYGIVPAALIFFAVAVCAVRLSAIVPAATVWSPGHAENFRRRWLPSMQARRKPVTRYER